MGKCPDTVYAGELKARHHRSNGALYGQPESRQGDIHVVLSSKSEQCQEDIAMPLCLYPVTEVLLNRKTMQCVTHITRDRDLFGDTLSEKNGRTKDSLRRTVNVIGRTTKSVHCKALVEIFDSD